MQFESFSILTGTEACNARCPFCVAKISPTFEGVDSPAVHWRNFHKAAQIARDARTSTAIITSYGDPTLFPDAVTSYLQALQEYKFPLVEMQTNAILFETHPKKFIAHVKEWYATGLDIIAISIAHYDPEINRLCYLPHKKQYIDLQKTIHMLRDIGFSIRLNCTLCSEWIDSTEKLKTLIQYAQTIGAFQLTVRPVNRPNDTRDQAVSSWVSNRLLSTEQTMAMKTYLDTHGIVLLKKPYGATVYDLNGFNVCFTNCFTRDDNPDRLRQLIFFPNGAVRYDWEHNAILLAAKK